MCQCATCRENHGSGDPYGLPGVRVWVDQYWWMEVSSVISSMQSIEDRQFLSTHSLLSSVLSLDLSPGLGSRRNQRGVGWYVSALRYSPIS